MRHFKVINSIMIVLSFIALVGCWPPNRSKSPPPPAANADINIAIKSIDPNANALFCRESRKRFVIKIEPERLSGMEGRETELILDKDIRGSLLSAREACVFRTSAINLRAGIWRISAQSFPAVVTAQCQEELRNGSNNVNFTISRSGCRRVGFP